ncbi:Chemotaxis protein CheA [Pirellula sp. SH-Sr6A]|uniref:hybrid sensor histidine kinase/response regulator n=1 Tax=Pirellula sp. SH-Sr6A TaxID=1632865 RepID=UPI00078C9969|nr:chemotaxis protein CheW [Pirellula sp. SH-Sr6A]AMV30577.1 Chemotaxis protein CheA [Pirellula sp. SH-Sr6A]
MFQDDELIQDFVVESSSHLADIESQLLEIEAAGDNIDIELVNTVFRAIHSVKGAAGFLSLAVINSLAHSLENVLNMIRNRELVMNKRIVNTLLRASDQLRSLVEHVESSNEVDVGNLIEELDRIHRGEMELGDSDAFEMLEELVEEEMALEDNVPDIESQHEEIMKNVEIAAALPTKAQADPKTVAGSTSKPKATDSIVRVNVAVLDRLMNLAGELVLSRNQLLAAVIRGGREGLDTVAARVDQVTSELQETIMQTRMQPIGTVFNRFPRVVRDLSSKLGKECDLIIEGNEVEVDKTIVEAMGDPLTHLVRNSIDHGIESPGKRATASKRPIGTVRLHAFHQAGKVCIRIEDDGAGMDPVKLKTKAVEKGVIGAEQAAVMTDSEALRLIFAPGFSTAAEITDVSGRGVGMDVVKTNIEQLGGTVDVESELGVGSAIHITLPLTLAIVPSMIVSCGGERYAIPQANIAELVRVPGAEVEEKIGRIHGAEVLRLRGALLPLIRLDEALGVVRPDDYQSESHATSILVLETGQMRYGLVVDTLHDNEEIVVKPLGKHVRDLGYLAGATILGDGYVALILDAVGIAMHCNLRNVDSVLASEQKESKVASEVHRLLLFANHPDDQFAIPMAMVARIERIRASEIRVVGGQNILVYRGASLPILRLEQNISALYPDKEEQNLFVIIFKIQDREIGLAAPTLRDIRDIEMLIDSKTLREPGVLGTVIVDDSPTRVLDLIELVRIRYADWFQSEPSTQTGKSIQPPSVLLAEDSDFFRNHVTRTLESEGIKVVGAVDGLDAWESLQSMVNEIDVIVTDIEMPRMNGLDFAKAVRADDATSRLPIIALTSLAGDDDRDRGTKAGINEYQVKMDPARLIDAVKRLAAASV